MSSEGLGIKDSSSDCTDFTDDTETPDNHPDNVWETSAGGTLDTANETTRARSEGHIGLDLFSDLSSDRPEPEILCMPGTDWLRNTRQSLCYQMPLTPLKSREKVRC